MSGEADRETGLSSDSVFELLSSKRRRMVLFYLRQHDGPATVNELARQIAAMENDVEVDDLTSQQQKRVYVSLYQTHLPKLESMGIIDYDQDEGQVRLTSRATEIDTYLSPPPETTYPWQLHYLVLAGASVGLLALSVLGVPGFAAIPPVWIGLAVTVAFAVSAIAQFVRRRQRRREIPPELK